MFVITELFGRSELSYKQWFVSTPNSQTCHAKQPLTPPSILRKYPLCFGENRFVQYLGFVVSGVRWFDYDSCYGLDNYGLAN